MRLNKLNSITYLFIGLSLVSCCNCKDTPSTSIKEKKVITGNFTWNQWQQESGWESYEPANFAPDGDALLRFSNKFDEGGWSFLLFAGSWCGDSESEVPKIFKLFSIAGIDFKNITLVGVDRDKREPGGIADIYSIQKVPTLIILYNSKEVGRIVEYPEKSWEADLSDIMNNKN